MDLRRVLLLQAHERVQGKEDFVGMRCTLDYEPLPLDGIVSDGTDFHQFTSDNLRVSHRNFRLHTQR